MSRDIFFTSDTHFFHANAIGHNDRPFNNVEEMNETFIDNWNGRVKKDSIIYHLGDVTWKDMEVVSQLKGEKHLVPGNHDKGIRRDTKNFHSIKDLHNIKVGEHYIVMCHFPIERWDRSHYGSIHLHGHSHGHLDSYGRLRFDVGVDCNSYTPIHIDEILAKLPSKLEEKEHYEEVMQEALLQFKRGKYGT